MNKDAVLDTVTWNNVIVICEKEGRSKKRKCVPTYTKRRNRETFRGI